MNLTLLEQSLIDNARTHQEALAGYYPKQRAGLSNDDDLSEYFKHSGSLSDLVSLTHRDSGLSGEAAEQLRQIEAEDIATFKLHFPAHIDFPFQDGHTESVDVSKADHILELGGLTLKV